MDSFLIDIVFEDTEEWKNRIQKELIEFKQSKANNYFVECFNSKRRAVIHEICRKLNLYSRRKSKNVCNGNFCGCQTCTFCSPVLTIFIGVEISKNKLELSRKNRNKRKQYLKNLYSRRFYEFKKTSFYLNLCQDLKRSILKTIQSTLFNF